MFTRKRNIWPPAGHYKFPEKIYIHYLKVIFFVNKREMEYKSWWQSENKKLMYLFKAMYASELIQNIENIVCNLIKPKHLLQFIYQRIDICEAYTFTTRQN